LRFGFLLVLFPENFSVYCPFFLFSLYNYCPFLFFIFSRFSLILLIFSFFQISAYSYLIQMRSVFGKFFPFPPVSLFFSHNLAFFLHLLREYHFFATC